MSGNYPDVPDHRMALDKDGSIFLKIDGSNVVTELSNSEIIAANNESDSGAIVTGTYTANWGVVLFPELRDLAGYMFCSPNNQYYVTSLQTSTDTTTGLDGTWVMLSAGNVCIGPIATRPTYRTTISTCSLSSIRAVKFYASCGNDGGQVNFHLYGSIHTGENLNRLAIWHPTSDAQVGPAYFDWGDVPRNSSASRTFRVKNLSSTLTASTITCSTDALTDTTPSVVGQHTLSSDGTTFATTATVSSLAPGAISAPLTLRRTTPGDAVLSLWDLRLNATAASWA